LLELHAARIRSVVRRRVVVWGRVQGVGFRWSVRERARQRDVAGWVGNRGDGAVEAVFEGDTDAVEQLVRFMSEGPRGAAVERFDIDEEDPEGLDRFDVR
jgi:acylphosphatase